MPPATEARSTSEIFIKKMISFGYSRRAAEARWRRIEIKGRRDTANLDRRIRSGELNSYAAIRRACAEQFSIGGALGRQLVGVYARAVAVRVVAEAWKLGKPAPFRLPPLPKRRGQGA